MPSPRHRNELIGLIGQLSPKRIYLPYLQKTVDIDSINEYEKREVVS